MKQILLLALAACGTVMPTSEPTAPDADAYPTSIPIDGLTLEIVGGQVHDERGDTIDFSSGEPVHAHVGPTTALGATGCPAVYKYAYLMDRVAPAYGNQLAPNPLAWQTRVHDDVELDGMAIAYRVRADNGDVLLDWTSSSTSLVELHRDVIPALGTRDGVMHLDVRARDRLGHDAIATACWEHHPLAAPVELSPIAGAPGSAAIFQQSLPADSPISKLVGASGTQFDVASQRLVVHAAEPVTLAVSATTPTASYARTIVTKAIETQTSPGLACGTSAAFSTDPRCTTGSLGNSTDPGSGPLGAAAWTARVVDDATGQPVCTSTNLHATCQLPARAVGQAAKAYRVVVSIGDAADLWNGSAADEYTFQSVTYTGAAPTLIGPHCDRMVVLQGLSGASYACQIVGNYTRIIALQHARLDFDPITVQIRTSPSSTVAVAPPAYEPAASFTTAPISWDSGVDVLP